MRSARLLPLLGAAVLGGCISLETAPMVRQPLTAKQRLLVLVYAGPGPLLSEDDSKAETAAKIIPGLGLVVKDVQDQRDLKASQELQQYLPGWDAATEFDAIARKQVASLGAPSNVIAKEDTGLPPDTWHKLNASSSILDWQTKYMKPQREDLSPSRNYSRFLQLDDVVVLELNLAYGLSGDADGNYSPNVKVITKLLRANVMQPLWRGESSITETGVAKTLYEYKVEPQLLVSAWKRLLPALSAKVVEDFRTNLQAAGVALDPYKAQREAADAAAQPGGMPMGPGWAPAPVPVSSASAEPAAPGAPFTPRPSTP
jgi:hypothetical protein